MWRYIGNLDFIKPGLDAGNISLTIPHNEPALVSKLKRERVISKVGLGLIVCGGVLQAITNYMP